MSHQAFGRMNARSRMTLHAIGAMVAMLSAVSMSAAEPDTMRNVESRYSSERLACTSGGSQQDRATCLKEAGAARDEARHGRLGAGSVASESNATARCNALPAKDRDDCIARINGAGTTSGSVREGGIYRELVTTTPVPAVATPPSAPQQ